MHDAQNSVHVLIQCFIVHLSRIARLLLKKMGVWVLPILVLCLCQQEQRLDDALLQSISSQRFHVLVSVIATMPGRLRGSLSPKGTKARRMRWGVLAAARLCEWAENTVFLGPDEAVATVRASA